jgi:hypothetical protein
MHTKKIMTYGVGNSGPRLGQAYKCGRVTLVNEIPTLPSDNWISNKQAIQKTCTDSLPLKKIEHND